MMPMPGSPEPAVDPGRSNLGSPTLRSHLGQNELLCIRANVMVRVDSMSEDGRVAMCSVHQDLYGPFRRTRSFHELVWRAEQALAPLSATGIIPLITVHPKPGHGEQPGADGPRNKLTAWWRWMGYLLSPPRHGNRIITDDPFGWNKAMDQATGSSQGRPKRRDIVREPEVSG